MTERARYTVRPGDSPWLIAKRYTGDGGRWRELAHANPHKRLAVSGFSIYPGEVLAIPESWPDTGATAVEGGRYAWRTRPSGHVEVNGVPPTLSGAAAQIFDSRVWRWRDIATKWATHFAVPVHWVLGMIHAESAGNPDARSADGGYGLMQLTSSGARQGHDYEDLRNPELNIQLGTRYIANIRTPVDDLPSVASKYNAGARTGMVPHPSNSSPWGYRETTGHISRVVAAANYALGKASGDAAPKNTLQMFLVAFAVLRWLT